MTEPTFDLLCDLVRRAQAPAGMHVGELLREHGVDRADALAWTRIGGRMDARSPARCWYLCLHEYAAWHFRLELDAFSPDEALDVVLAYELGRSEAPNPTNQIRTAMQHYTEPTEV
jgi:hypothetical protein